MDDNPSQRMDAISREAADASVVAGLVNHTIFQRDMPVAGVSLYRRDVVVRKRRPDGVQPSKGGRQQGAVITEFSERSRYNLLFRVKNCDVDFASMATLTYPSEFPGDGRIVKEHLNVFSMRFKRKFTLDRGIWFLEFQRRGAPHYHVLLSVVMSDHGPLETWYDSGRRGKKFRTCRILHDWLSYAWFEIVGSGDEKHLKRGCSWEVLEKEDAALRYAAMHAGKPHQKIVPEKFINVGRFWGCIGQVKARELGRINTDTVTVFEKVGYEAMSRRGRVKKYLWDEAEKFSDELRSKQDAEFFAKLKQEGLL